MPHSKHSAHHTANAKRHINLRLERWHRWSVYIVCGWLLASGVLWLLAHYLMRPVGEFGESIHPLEPWSMKLHGAGAMVMLYFFGTLLNSHIRRALKAERNLYSGWSMVAVLLLLIVSGYGLYYIAGEASRPVWSIFHWVIGLAFPVLVFLHIFLGRKSRV